MPAAAPAPRPRAAPFNVTLDLKLDLALACRSSRRSDYTLRYAYTAYHDGNALATGGGPYARVRSSTVPPKRPTHPQHADYLAERGMATP